MNCLELFISKEAERLGWTSWYLDQRSILLTDPVVDNINPPSRLSAHVDTGSSSVYVFTRAVMQIQGPLVNIFRPAGLNIQSNHGTKSVSRNEFVLTEQTDYLGSNEHIIQADFIHSAYGRVDIVLELKDVMPPDYAYLEPFVNVIEIKNLNPTK